MVIISPLNLPFEKLFSSFSPSWKGIFHGSWDHVCASLQHPAGLFFISLLNCGEQGGPLTWRRFSNRSQILHLTSSYEMWLSTTSQTSSLTVHGFTGFISRDFQIPARCSYSRSGLGAADPRWGLPWVSPPMPHYPLRNVFRPQAGFSSILRFLSPSPLQRWCSDQAGSMVLAHDFSWHPSRAGGKRPLGSPGESPVHRRAMPSPKSGQLHAAKPWKSLRMVMLNLSGELSQLFQSPP